MNGAQLDDLVTLMASIFAHEQAGRSVPCVDPRRGHLWLSDDAEEQEAAALACRTCPALVECSAYIASHRELAGIWAGRRPPTRAGAR